MESDPEESHADMPELTNSESTISDAESESSAEESARESEAGEVKNVEQRESKLFEKIGVPLNE